MNAALDTVDGQSRLRMRRTLAHPPRRVWQAITEAEQLARWFPAAVTMPPEGGNEITFDFGDGNPTHGVVTEREPPRVLAYTWGDDLLRWELDGRGGETLLTFTHTFADRAGAASFAAGWDVCLDALDSALAGAAAEPPGDTTAAHEAYIRAFGLDEGTAEQTAGGWRVRFERQLTVPAEAV